MYKSAFTITKCELNTYLFSYDLRHDNTKKVNYGNARKAIGSCLKTTLLYALYQRDCPLWSDSIGVVPFKFIAYAIAGKYLQRLRIRVSFPIPGGSK